MGVRDVAVRYFECIHAHDANGLSLLFAEGGWLRPPPPIKDELQGREAICRFYSQLFASIPDHLITVQSLLEGRRPALAETVAPDAGALLHVLHGSPRGTFPDRTVAAELDAVARTFRTLRFLAPWLTGRLDMLLGTLELAMPGNLERGPAHGDFRAAKLVQQRDAELGITDLDSLCVAPRALDLATYAAHVVRGGDKDLDVAGDILADLVKGYGDVPDGLRWYFATAILRRATLPFRYLDERWPEKVVAMIDAGETALSQ